MSARTKNIYGRITISNKAIESFIGSIASDCYGVVEFVPENLYRKIVTFFYPAALRSGVKVKSVGDKINISVYVNVKYGMSVRAVVESLKETLKYRVEKFTGMIVDTIDVTVCGVKL